MSAEVVQQFKEFTGTEDDEIAKQLLQCCDGDVSRAVELFFARQAVADSVQNGSEMDADVEVIEEIEPEIVVAESLPPTSSRAKADKPADPDEVRAPLQKVQGRLVEDSYREQYGNRRRRAAHPIFEQNHEEAGSSSMWRHGDDDELAGPAEKRQRSLKDLFRPPVELITNVDWDSLQMMGVRQHKWLLVNLQDSGEFASQILNRDVWSNQALKDLIKANFFFWQMYRDSSQGSRVAGYYSIYEFPGVFIIDPRTGELVQRLTAMEPTMMRNLLVDFIEKCPDFETRDRVVREENRQISLHPSERILRIVDPVDMTEEERMNREPIIKERLKETISNLTYRFKDLKAKTNGLRCSKHEAEDSNKPSTSKSSENRAVYFHPWQSYWPPHAKDMIKVALMMPNNERKNISVPIGAPLISLFAFLHENQLDPAEHQFVLCYPRRVFPMDQKRCTLQELGFQNMELVHVERS